MANILEEFMLNKIKKIDADLASLKREDHTQSSFDIAFSRLTGQKDVLYLCLTAHDNTYDQKVKK